MFAKRTNIDGHLLFQIKDRLPYLYFEAGCLDLISGNLVFHNSKTDIHIPIARTAVIMLGPGTSVTAAAVQTVAAHNCPLCWVGEEGVRLYANSIGTQQSQNLLKQIRIFSDQNLRLSTARKMLTLRFPNANCNNATLSQLRGIEGLLMKQLYTGLSKTWNVEWKGRMLDRNQWDTSSPVNKAISTTNTCLYGICHSAIIACGCSPAIGFIHEGHGLSFVWDIADLFKADFTLPVAFRLASEQQDNMESAARKACVHLFYEKNLMNLVVPTILEIINDGNNR